MKQLPHISPREKFNFSEVWSRAKKNAVARGIPFELSIEDHYALVKRSNGYCMVSGIKFSNDSNTGRSRRRPFAPSLDRINSNKGYTKDNCRLVCIITNMAMNEWGEAPLMALAEAIYKTRLDPDRLPPVKVTSKTYITCKEFLADILNPPVTAQQLSSWALAECKRKGIERQKRELPVSVRSDGSVATGMFTAYPKSVLQKCLTFTELQPNRNRQVFRNP